MKTIFIDLDNSINALSESFIKIAQKLGYKIKPNIQDNYNLSAGLVKPVDCMIDNITDYIFCQKGFWVNIPILPGAQDVINKLNEYYTIIFLTTPYINSVTCREEKMLWLQRYFDWIDRSNVIFSNNKCKFEDQGDLLIEDKPSTLLEWTKPKFKVYHPYNEFVQSDFTIYDWKYQAQDIIQKVKEFI